MLETITTLLGSPLLGGILGSVSAFFTKREERKTLQLQMEHKEKMAVVTSKLRREELALESDITEKELDGEAFVASQKYGNNNTGVGWVEGIKATVRPIITIYLLVVVSVLAYNLHILVGGLDIIPVSELVVMYKEIISSVLLLSTLSVSWWFGQRKTSSFQGLK